MSITNHNELKKIPKLQVNVRLTGTDAERFQRYKEKEKLKSNAVASYKLIFERLEQIDAEAQAA